MLGRKLQRENKLIGIVVALKNEANAIKALMSNSKESTIGYRRFIQGRLSEKKCTLVLGGLGKIHCASATQLLIDNFKCEYLVNIGTAGAISSQVHVGDFVIGEKVVEFDCAPKVYLHKPPSYVCHQRLVASLKAFFAEDRTLKSVHFGQILSGSEDVVTDSRKKELFQLHKALSTDWESAGFIATCNMNQTPGVVFRVISDLANESMENDFNKFGSEQLKALSHVLEKVIAKVNC